MDESGAATAVAVVPCDAPRVRRPLAHGGVVQGGHQQALQASAAAAAAAAVTHSARQEDRAGEEPAASSGRTDSTDAGVAGASSSCEAQRAVASARPSSSAAAAKEAVEEEQEEEGEGVEALQQYCFETLQRLHPGQRISQQSMALLVGLLEGLTEQVVTKAHESAQDKGVISSAEIQQAVRSILPPAVGDDGRATGERQAFRPFLPTAAKRARQLDKQTLKGRQRKTLKQHPTSSDAVPPLNGPTPPAACSKSTSSERVS